MQNSAKNVDDSMRIINRLIVALSELSSMKSVSGILHTCATLGKNFLCLRSFRNLNVLIVLSMLYWEVAWESNGGCGIIVACIKNTHLS